MTAGAKERLDLEGGLRAVALPAAALTAGVRAGRSRPVRSEPRHRE
jgi:hypothetical protein